MPVVVECNEPLVPLEGARSPRVWLTMLEEDLPGKWLKTRVQLHHGLVDEDTKFENVITALYKKVFETFAKSFGESTRCFLMRAPEAVELVGKYLPNGPTTAFACFETVLAVSKRTDKKVSIVHVDGAFAPVEFELNDGLPKGRVNEWASFSKGRVGKHWADAIKSALQYYLNGHTGPTGQIELEIPGLNIVVGAVLPPGESTHNATSLAAAGYAAISAASGDWGKQALSEIVIAVEESAAGAGRTSNAAAVCFGMPLEVLHIERDPYRAKGHKLVDGTAILLAHTGGGAAAPAVKTTDLAALLDALKRGWVERLSESAMAADALLSDRVLYDVVAELPDNQRALALYLVSETRRAQRAMEAVRKGDAETIGALLNVGHTADEVTGLRITSSGVIEQTFTLPDYYSQEALETIGYHGDPLWKQAGRSSAGSAETDLIASLAQSVTGVYGARRAGDQTVAILCKKEVVQFVKERLVGGYYADRKLPNSLVTQVHACRGVSVVEGT